MKYALIGCGRISPNHITAAQNNNLDIAALCDTDPDAMNSLAEKFTLEDTRHHASCHDMPAHTDLVKCTRFYTNYHDMLEREHPDLVAIATESGRHASIAMDCLDAGCNIIIEKPITLSLKDADDIIRKAHDTGFKVCVSHQNRFNLSIRKIREAMISGRFGRLFYGTAHIRWNRGKGYYSAASWRGTWSQDGGALMNQCIHNIDLLRWMMGDEIDTVMGITDRLAHPYIECEDLGIAIVKFRNGAYGIIEGTTDIYPANLEETLYIFGEKGTVKAGGQSVNKIEEWRFSDGLEDSEEVIANFSENPPNIYGFGHTSLYADVIDAIMNDREPYVNAEAGRRALELVLAIYKSASEGMPVKLPLTECSTLDFAGRFGGTLNA